MPLNIGQTYDLSGIGRVRIERPTAKGKKKSAVRLSDGRRINFGQAGERVSPGTARGDAFCARSIGANSRGFNANTLARIDWGCNGRKSSR